MFTHRIDDRLELRLYTHEHADEVYSTVIANREHIRPFLPWVDNVKSVDDTKDFIRRGLEQYSRNDGFQAGIWEDGRYVGGIGMHWIKWEPRYTELGYWLAGDAQGRGVMTRACRAIIDHCFHTLKLNRVEIRCVSANQRSRAIPQRLGFTQEAVLRQIAVLHGERVDMVVYGLLASEWGEKGTADQSRRG